VEAALTVAALMKTDLIGEAGFEVVDLEDVGEEFDEFEYFVVQSCMLVRMLLDMEDAGAGGGDDIVKFIKVLYEKVCAAF
jgi:hypothetical protein